MFISALLLAPTAAHAQLAIDRLWVDLEDKGVTRSDLVVRNESEDVYYITVTPMEVIAPGTEQEERRTVADPEQLGLLVTPNRLILRPNEMRAVRLVSLNRDLDQDRIYRVNVTPQIGEISISNENAEEGSRGLAMKVLAAFDVLVTVRPDGGRPDLTAIRSGSSLELVNGGNSSLLLLSGKVCPAEGSALAPATVSHYREAAQEGLAEDAEPVELQLDELGCASLPGKRLYAGNRWPIFAGPNEFLTFQSRRTADQNFQELVVRCALDANMKSNSDFCRWAEANADAGEARITSANQEMENTP